jgi:hypothetical protein
LTRDVAGGDDAPVAVKRTGSRREDQRSAGRSRRIVIGNSAVRSARC